MSDATFNQQTLRAAIVDTWGPAGAHIDVFDHMLTTIGHHTARALVLQRELLAVAMAVDSAPPGRNMNAAVVNTLRRMAEGDVAPSKLSAEHRAVIVDVLCGQALADHLGDVRRCESALWDLIDAPKLDWDHPAYNAEGAWPVTKARLEAAGIPLPDYLQGSDDGE